MKARAAALLGLIQGAAEPLPISSSAHVMLIRDRLGDREGDPGAEKALDVALHAGSLAALALRRPGRPPFPVLLAATAPPVLAGVLLERPIEARLRGPRALAAGLLAGSAALLAADRAPAGRRAAEATWRDGVALGLAQAAALAPGVSRLGATQAAARARGFTRADARVLAVQAGMPVIAGAVALKGARAVGGRTRLTPLAAGAATAFVATLAADVVARGGPRVATRAAPLWPFAAYRCALAAVLLCQDGRP